MVNVTYTPYIGKWKSSQLPTFKLPDIVKKSNKTPVIINPLPEYETQVETPVVVEPTVIEQPITRGTTIFKTPGINVGNMQSVLDKFNEHGISLRVTSGLRPGAVTSSGKQSNHSIGNAIDVTPGEGETWDTLRSKIKNTPALIKWMQDNGWGILDETTQDMLARTGGTGAHWHIGSDDSAKKGLLKLIAKNGGILKAQQGVVLIDPYPEGYQKQFDLSWNPFKSEKVSPIRPELQDKHSFRSIPGMYMDNLNHIADRLKDAGFSKEQSAAILGTVMEESQGNPLTVGDNGKARGLFQWHGARFQATDDLDSQIDLIINELRDYKNSNGWLSSKKYNKQDAINAFNGNDLHAIITALTANFIRPANTDSAIERRYNQAQQIYKQLI